MGHTIEVDEKIYKALLSSVGEEFVDFAQFLKLKEEGFSYKQVKDSAGYVRSLRNKEGRRTKSAKNYIEELIEWQN